MKLYSQVERINYVNFFAFNFLLPAGPPLDLSAAPKLNPPAPPPIDGAAALAPPIDDWPKAIPPPPPPPNDAPPPPPLELKEKDEFPPLTPPKELPPNDAGLEAAPILNPDDVPKLFGGLREVLLLAVAPPPKPPKEPEPPKEDDPKEVGWPATGGKAPVDMLEASPDA